MVGKKEAHRETVLLGNALKFDSTGGQRKGAGESHHETEGERKRRNKITGNQAVGKCQLVIDF